MFKLDPVVSFSTYFRDSYCLKGSVIFRLSNGIIFKGAKSYAVVVVGVYSIFELYVILTWNGLISVVISGLGVGGIVVQLPAFF